MTRNFAANLADVFWRIKWFFNKFCYTCFLIRYESYVRPNGQGFFSFYWQILCKSVIKFTHNMDFQEDIHDQDGKWQVNFFYIYFFFIFFQISLKFFQNYLLSFEIIKRNQNFFILLSFLQNSLISFKNEFIWDIWHDITNPSHSFQSVIFLHSSKTILSLIPVHWWKFLYVTFNSFKFLEEQDMDHPIAQIL